MKASLVIVIGLLALAVILFTTPTPSKEQIEQKAKITQKHPTTSPSK